MLVKETMERNMNCTSKSLTFGVQFTYQDGLSLSDDYLIQKCNYYKYDAVKRQGYIRALKERFTDYEIREMLREGILKK